MNIHQKINAKGNLKKWFGPKSFIRKVSRAMKEGYATEERLKTGSKLFYSQDTHRAEKDPTPTRDEAWSGGFAANH